jgi:dTMP kinase
MAADGPVTDSAGFFVTLEGGEGVGKSTLQATLVERAAAAGREVVSCREPGGTALSERLRAALFASEDGETDAIAELLVFEAARAQLVAEVIRPAITRGAIVICDRFADSTVAYQHHGRGLSAETVERVNEIATGGLRPDLTVLLDLDPAEGARRRGEAGDYLEREDGGFHDRVRAGFLSLAAADPERWVVVDAAQPADEVAEAAWRELSARL